MAIRDIRIKRIDLPEDVSAAVFERMRSEREREAREWRAQGQEEAERIRANADRRRQVLLAQANERSETLRGEGDAEAAAIFSEAYGQDQEFLLSGAAEMLIVKVSRVMTTCWYWSRIAISSAICVVRF